MIEYFRRLFDECSQEIDRLTRSHATGKGRQWANSFRGGCVRAIHLAIKDERDALRDELRGVVSETALVIVDTRADEAKGAGPKNLSSGRASTAATNYEAREAGIQAGAGIYNGTRDRIASPTRRIGG